MRILGALLLALAPAAHAAALRVTLEAPLAPVTGSPATAAEVPALATPFSPWLPALAPAALPLGAVPAAAPAFAAAVPVLPAALAAPTAAAAVRPAAPAEAPRRVVESLREHGALAAEAAATKGDAAAPALEANFLSAAALHSGGPGSVVPPGATPPPAAGSLRGPVSRDTLTRRLLQSVRLEGTPRERRELMRVFERMLKSPTARRYAEEFIAEGIAATVRFDDLPDSVLYMQDERLRFSGARAVTDAPGPKQALVRFNRRYLEADPIFLRDDAPPILAHELLGHGRWYSRAMDEEIRQPFHNSELNEGVARTLGWVVDYELDRRFEENGTWSFLHDPEGYNRRLKTLLPFYALTFSRSEMADIEATLRSRLDDARRALKDEERHLASHRTWAPVVDHFVEKHGVPAERFALLRTELDQLEAYWASEVENAKAVVATIELVLKNLDAETAAGEKTSVRAMREAATRPFFARLEAEQDELTRLLAEVTRANPPAPAPPAPARPAGQYTFQDLQAMYQNDLAEDATRRHRHWN